MGNAFISEGEDSEEISSEEKWWQSRSLVGRLGVVVTTAMMLITVSLPLPWASRVRTGRHSQWREPGVSIPRLCSHVALILLMSFKPSGFFGTEPLKLNWNETEGYVRMLISQFTVGHVPTFRDLACCHPAGQDTLFL